MAERILLRQEGRCGLPSVGGRGDGDRSCTRPSVAGAGGGDRELHVTGGGVDLTTALLSGSVLNSSTI